MARLPLLLYPNPRLREVSEPLTWDWTKQEGFQERLKDLKETLVWYRGVGMSAIQAGWPVRLFVMRTAKEIQTFVNPRILETDGDLTEMDEGCLSVPGVVERVMRYPSVIIESMDMDTGMFDRWDLEGIEAQCAQHEIDHLDGKMFTDGYGGVKRDIAKRKIKKFLREESR